MKKCLKFLFFLPILFALNSCVNDDDGLNLSLNNPPNSSFLPCEDGEDISISSLPQAIRDYIADNYPGYVIDEAEQFFNDVRFGVEIERDDDDDDDLELLFTEDGVLISSGDDDDDDDRTVPVANLPQSVLDYIEANYPGLSIGEAELELEYGLTFYEIELDDDIELYFSEDGTFLCRDDDGDGDGDDDDDGGDDDDATVHRER